VKSKITVTVSIAVVVSVILLFNGFSRGDDYNQEKLVAQIVYTGLERWHYSGKKIDNDFSAKAFTEFINYLDFSKRFLLQSDIETLQQYKYKIDDQFAEGNSEFVKAASNLIQKRISQVTDFYAELLSKPFDFNAKESLELEPEKNQYCKTIDEIKEYWRKNLKYRALLRYIALKETNEKDKKKKNDKELEEEARKSVLTTMKPVFNRLTQTIKNDSFSAYINSLVQVTDPHTTYFSPTDKETFDMQIKGSFEGIGATLQDEGEYVKVVNIIPGGPSWRQKQLEAGDLIVKVAQGNDEPVDIIGMRTADAVKLIRGKKSTLVRLSVKKPDGRIIEIPIVRDVVILEETFAKSAVLVDKKTGKHFGFINLPGFYNDFRGGRNSTDDVKKELEKLKSKKVDGVILDLRNNGGGALQDAVRMSGLFIPQGPILQVKNKSSQVSVLEDPNPGTTYSGPLVVLINQITASASEILSAALQDYNRAIIVGSNQSFGKGTVQALIDLDNFVTQKDEDKESFGALTITIQKFYRVNGDAIQLKGVSSNIVLPDRYDYLEIGEKYMDFPLSWDSIPPASYTKWKPEPLVTQSMIEKSRDRVQSNQAFIQIKDYADKVKHFQDKKMQTLKIDEVLKEQDQIKQAREKLDKVKQENPNMQVLPTIKLPVSSSDRMNIVEKERQEEWFKELRNDITIGEAMEILSDLIDMQKIKSTSKGENQEKK